MRSEFERSSAQAAVDAVERRWQHDQDIKNRQRRLKAIRNTTAVIALMVIAAIAFEFFSGHIDPKSFTFKAEKPLATGSLSQVERYAQPVRLMRAAPRKLLSAMPADVTPGQAKAGTHYFVLSRATHRSFDIYEMTADGNGHLAVNLLSPFAPPRQIAFAEFKKASANFPYLILVNGVCYLANSQDLNAAERLLASVIK